jgi:hypothetical protein
MDRKRRLETIVTSLDSWSDKELTELEKQVRHKRTFAEGSANRLKLLQAAWNNDKADYNGERSFQESECDWNPTKRMNSSEYAVRKQLKYELPTTELFLWIIPCGIVPPVRFFIGFESLFLTTLARHFSLQFQQDYLLRLTVNVFAKLVTSDYYSPSQKEENLKWYLDKSKQRYESYASNKRCFWFRKAHRYLLQYDNLLFLYIEWLLQLKIEKLDQRMPGLIRDLYFAGKWDHLTYLIKNGLTLTSLFDSEECYLFSEHSEQMRHDTKLIEILTEFHCLEPWIALELDDVHQYEAWSSVLKLTFTEQQRKAVRSQYLEDNFPAPHYPRVMREFFKSVEDFLEAFEGIYRNNYHYSKERIISVVNLFKTELCQADFETFKEESLTKADWKELLTEITSLLPVVKKLI